MNESYAARSIYDGEDMDHLKGWIGREERTHGKVDEKAIARFSAIFEDVKVDGDNLPHGIHWTLFNAINPLSKLGADGHPERGGFMPPVVLPRRMWAGGKLSFQRPLRAGRELTKTSRIADVNLKSGSSGPLVFVRLEHEISGPDGVAVRERQNIVYRAAATSMQKLPDPEISAVNTIPAAQSIEASPVLLFRYSALTENSHRIHYEENYACGEEFYPGLVVHGPLQATYLMLLAAKSGSSHLKEFSFRAVSPLIADGTFSLHIGKVEDGQTSLHTSDSHGRICMTAGARYANP